MWSFRRLLRNYGLSLLYPEKWLFEPIPRSEVREWLWRALYLVAAVAFAALTIAQFEAGRHWVWPVSMAASLFFVWRHLTLFIRVGAKVIDREGRRDFFDPD